VRKAFDTPLCVGLGKHNAWVVLYPDGYIAWKFYNYYSALDKILKDATPRSIAVSPEIRSVARSLTDLANSTLRSRPTTKSITLSHFGTVLSSITSREPRKNGCSS
jgi:hypothetical protein